MTRYHSICFGFLLLLCAGGFVIAEDIRIVGDSAYKKIALSLNGMKASSDAASRTFFQVLSDDLVRSGWFNVVSGPSAVVQVGGHCGLVKGRLSATCDVRNGATGRSYFSRVFSQAPDQSRQLAHIVADAIVEEVKGVRGIATTRFVLIGSTKGKKDLFVCDSDGHGMVQLTHDEAPCLSPTWGPRGDLLFYTSFYRGFPDVYRITLATGKRDRIASYPGINAGAAVSPDGRELALALSKDGNPELYVLALGSGKLTRLTKTKYAAEASPTWSPDGSSIAYVSDSTGSPQVYVISRSGGKSKRITFRGNENVSPDWGLDGRIAFSSRRFGHYQICVWDPAKRKEAQITTDGADYESPSWAPDGRHIACARTVGYNSDVYILDTLGDAPVRLTRYQGEWYAPNWSRR